MPRPWRRLTGLCGAGLVLALAGTGCTSIWARTRVSAAQTAVDSASQAGAEKKAPYAYTSALLYLEKAREEEAYARFGPAVEFSDLSEKYAEQAVQTVNSGAPEAALSATKP